MPNSKNILMEKAIDWFFQKTEDEKIDLKNKYYPNTPIPHSSQWGFHFTFGQIENMYLEENRSTIKNN